MTTASPRAFPLRLKPLIESEQLFTDIKRHNLDGLVQLLDHNASLDRHPKYGYPLLVAVGAGFLEAVRKLLEYGADINANDGSSALHIAISEGQTDIVDFLLEKGIDTSLLNTDSETALFLAIRARDVATVRKLLAHGCPLDTVNVHDDSPLSLAIVGKNQEIVQVLLKHRADPNGPGRHPLQTARDLGLVHIVHVLKLGGAKEAVRRPRTSRERTRGIAGMIENLQNRKEATAPHLDGSCYVCGATEPILRLLPCKHSVVCEDCVDLFCDRCKECPTCKLSFFATTRT
jgi:hypothetical protein